MDENELRIRYDDPVVTGSEVELRAVGLLDADDWFYVWTVQLADQDARKSRA